MRCSQKFDRRPSKIQIKHEFHSVKEQSNPLLGYESIVHLLLRARIHFAAIKINSYLLISMVLFAAEKNENKHKSAATNG